MVVALCLTIAGIAMLAIARRGDGRRDLRRCPRCWYAMEKTPGRTCPECGRTADTEAGLHQPRRRRGLEGASIVLMFAGVGFFIAGLSSRPWVSRVPTPALRALLDLMYDVDTPAAGLPVPDNTRMRSKQPLERARWHHTAAVAFEAWIREVTAPTGPITDAELSTLIPLANQANELFSDYGGTSHNEIRLIDRVTDRLARRWRTARDAQPSDPDQVRRLQWALAELQFQGGGYSHRPDWALPPADLILQAIAHPDPSVRIFGLGRASRIAQVVVMEPQNEPARQTLTLFVEPIRSAAATDPDPAVSRRAKDLITYLEMFALNQAGGG